MKTAIDVLMEVSVYAAVIAAAIFLFRLLFQKSVSPRLQYLVWMLLIVRLLLPVTFESGFHVESLFPKSVELPVAITDITPEAEPMSEAQTPLDNAVPIVPSVSVETAGESTVEKASIDLYALTAVVWVSGMAAFALWILVVKRRFYKRMELARVETPEVVDAVYKKCRLEAGVKHKMPLWVVDAAISPGIAFFNGLVLLLPTSIIDREGTLRFSLLHELAHQKRGDHFMGILLNVLRAVYWFHPVVHIAFSQMHSDMEIACDHDVTCLLKPSEKKGYLTAVLDLFSYAVEPQLGMAQFRTRYMARRRMKGAFMKANTSLTTKLAAGLLCLVLVTACFTTACQSAPLKTDIEPHTTDTLQSAGVPDLSASPVTMDPTVSPVSQSSPSATPASAPVPTALASVITAENRVTSIQERLTELGYTVQATGEYDEATSTAISTFQTRNGLHVDGYAGEDTISILYSDDALKNDVQGSAEADAYSPADISKMLEYAKAAVGKKYKSGAVGPDSFDSSGLVYYCLKMAGSDRPQLAVTKYAAVEDWEKVDDIDRLETGDLIFFYGPDNSDILHAGIVLDNTYMIDASSSANKVLKREYKTAYWETHFAYGRRPW